ncbi:hypothetical protein BDD12DRAFT_805572 [Trichophaea hybrida]|nr:hypothetical protein BDD12DRAFT_805572 [Trichophaea hybrida]
MEGETESTQPTDNWGHEVNPIQARLGTRSQPKSDTGHKVDPRHGSGNGVNPTHRQLGTRSQPNAQTIGDTESTQPKDDWGHGVNPKDGWGHGVNPPRTIGDTESTQNRKGTRSQRKDQCSQSSGLDQSLTED